MKLLNLILIVLIITIESFLSFVSNNALVFIKPENLTKTELVEKFKELSSSKTLKELKNIKNEDKKDENKITIREIIKSYFIKSDKFNESHKEITKNMAFLMRTWINKFHDILLPIDYEKVKVGTNNDSPVLSMKELLED